jgi:hypothetical protein
MILSQILIEKFSHIYISLYLFTYILIFFCPNLFALLCRMSTQNYKHVKITFLPSLNQSNVTWAQIFAPSSKALRLTSNSLKSRIHTLLQMSPLMITCVIYILQCKVNTSLITYNKLLIATIIHATFSN